MKKNYVLNILLLFSISFLYAQEDNSSSTSKKIIVTKKQSNPSHLTTDDLNVMQKIFGAGATTLSNLSKLFVMMSQKFDEIQSRGTLERVIIERPLGNERTSDGALQDGSSQPSSLGDNFSVITKKVFSLNKLKNIDYKNFIFIYQYLLPSPIKSILREQCNCFLTSCYNHISLSIFSENDEENISFESPCLTSNQILKRIIFENSQAIKPIAQRTFLDAVTLSTNNMIKGVIFCGQPGTGKTETARALAGKLNIPFLFKKVSDIFATT